MSVPIPAAGRSRGMVHDALRHDAWPLALISLVLAAVGAVAMQLAWWVNALPVGPVELLFIAGMVGFAWAAIASVVVGVALWKHRGDAGRGWMPSAVVTAAAVALIALTVTLHPLLGTGGGSA